MAAPSKKRAVDEEMNEEENEDDSDNDSADDGCGEEMDTQEKVEIDFEARNPEDCDYHGIRKLLQQLFLKANVNLSELTDTIISQNYIGSIIQQAEVLQEEEADDEDDDMEVFGLTTVVNITERANLDCVKQMKDMLMNKCEGNQPSSRDTLSKVLNSPDNQVGLILNERFINIPAQISLPSFQSLWKEVERAKKKNMKYDFNKFLMICKTYRMPQQENKKKKGTKKEEDASSSLIFVNQEEENFHREAELTFEYSVAGERDKGVAGDWDDEEEDLIPYRTVIVVPASKMDDIMQSLKDDLALGDT